MAKQIKVTVGGKEYTLQHPGARWYAQHVDRCTGRNGVSTERYFEGILKNVVVEPAGLKLEDFDENIGDLEELITQAELFFRGKQT